MTQPLAKIHHNVAQPGEFVPRLGQEDYEALGLREFQFTAERKADLRKAIDFVDEQLAFWATTQFHDMDPEMVAGNRILFKAMRNWPGVTK